ncbi:MAG: 16S rRNA (guanine(966)-N(2))-methyltransferase RsmD, partial [Alphaproteobacteria bacterium]
MRITAGRHKGRRLAVPPGLTVRPTADRARQALFNMLAHGGHELASDIPGNMLRDANVVDLFAGTGALGLEALSRGAAHVVFIEQAAPALEALRANITTLGDSVRTRVMPGDASRLRRRPADLPPATLVFLDPPYDTGLVAPALSSLVAADWLADVAVIAVECATGDTGWEAAATSLGYGVLRRRRYGAAD